MHARIAASLVVVGWFAGLASADWLGLKPPPPLTTAREIRSLSPDDARAGKPVQLTGVVTYANVQNNDLYIQDDTAGICVLPTPQSAGLKPGDRIVVRGITDAGEFSPCVSVSTIERLGPGKLPDPFPFDLSFEDSRWMDGQWIQCWVEVRSVSIEAQSTRLDIVSRHGNGTIVVPGIASAAEARSYQGRTVTVRGVCVATFANRMVSGPPRILVAELSQARALPPSESESPDSAPRMIDYLLRFSPSPHPGPSRRKITGVVTAAPAPGLIVVQDASGGAFVSMTGASNDVPVGTRVDVVGLARIDGRRLTMTQAQVTILNPERLPFPLPCNGGELSAGIHDLLLVRLEGQVESVRIGSVWTTLTLVDGAARFEAYYPAVPDQHRERFEPGARVAIVGVATDIGPDSRPGTGSCVYLPTAESLVLLQSPPQPAAATWWTATRAAWLFGGFFAVLLLGGGWLLSLRLQVRKATREVQRQYEEKDKLERQLRQAAKLEAVGRLAGGIAHDFNNLLTVINGCAELLTDEATPVGGRLTELAVDIRRAGERAAALTGQLLTFSRKRDVVVSAVDLNDVVGEAVRLLDRVLGENILIRTHLAPVLPRVRGEASLLHQVVMNLAVNARDAMPAGGALTLSTANVSEPVVLPATPAGGSPITFRHFVRLTVTDSGVGMTDDVKARIFEPFFTTKEVGTGTGLGLATVYGIIQTVRGRIRVDSQVGRGTTFHIDLRIHGDSASDSDLAIAGTAPAPVRRLMGASALAGRTVLVVEDNAMVRDLLVSCLTADGAVVLSAEDSAQALRALAEFPTRVDVMVTDVVMPGMSGRLLADRVRTERPGMHVIFMSGYTADEVLREGVLADQVEFIQKPFTPEHLTLRLLGVLKRELHPDRATE